MICAAGGRHLFTLSCPDGLFYDTSTETCQYPDQTICQPPCPVSNSVTASQQSNVTQESTTTPDMSSVTDGESTMSTVTDDTLTPQKMTVTEGKSTTVTDMSSVTDGDSTTSTVTDDTLTSQQLTVTGPGSITREGVTLTGTCTLVLKIFCSLISKRNYLVDTVFCRIHAPARTPKNSEGRLYSGIIRS